MKRFLKRVSWFKNKDITSYRYGQLVSDNFALCLDLDSIERVPGMVADDRILGKFKIM